MTLLLYRLALNPRLLLLLSLLAIFSLGLLGFPARRLLLPSLLVAGSLLLYYRYSLSSFPKALPLPRLRTILVFLPVFFLALFLLPLLLVLEGLIVPYPLRYAPDPLL